LEIITGPLKRPASTNNTASKPMIIEKQKRRNISNLKVDLGEPKRPGTSGKSGYQEFKSAKCVVTIDCLDYSEQLDLIAFGGI
jgi:hypothetical protein